MAKFNQKMICLLNIDQKSKSLQIWF